MSWYRLGACISSLPITGGTLLGNLTVNGALVATSGPHTFTGQLNVNSANIRVDNGQGIEWGGATNFITGNNTSNFLRFYTNDTQRVEINSTGAVTIANLAGTGSRTVVADANGVLSAP